MPWSIDANHFWKPYSLPCLFTVHLPKKIINKTIILIFVSISLLSDFQEIAWILSFNHSFSNCNISLLILDSDLDLCEEGISHSLFLAFAGFAAQSNFMQRLIEFSFKYFYVWQIFTENTPSHNEIRKPCLAYWITGQLYLNRFCYNSRNNHDTDQKLWKAKKNILTYWNSYAMSFGVLNFILCPISRLFLKHLHIFYRPLNEKYLKMIYFSRKYWKPKSKAWNKRCAKLSVSSAKWTNLTHSLYKLKKSLPWDFFG